MSSFAFCNMSRDSLTWRSVSAGCVSTPIICPRPMNDLVWRSGTHAVFDRNVPSRLWVTTLIIAISKTMVLSRSELS